MKKWHTLLISAILLALPLTASAGKGHGHHGKYKEEYWDGNCKVERKISKHGDYKEERKCKAPSHVYYAPAPAPVVVVAPPPPVVIRPGVQVHGTVSFGH